MITYSKFPLLLYTSYDKETAPEDLPFEMPDEATLQKVKQSQGFGKLFAYIATRNSLENKNTCTYFYLTNYTFNLVEFDAHFRNENFKNFFSEYVTPKRGCITFGEGGGTYVYVLLSVQETKALYNKNARYIGVAFFKENIFLGFEEGFIMQKNVEVVPNGIYIGGMDKGGYLSFCLITLAYANGRNLKTIASQVIRETIYEL